MEQIHCQCVSCDTLLAIFVNVWTQIGKGYCSPVVDAEYGDNLTVQGSKRDGEPGTLVAACVLQDLCCLHCGANVGHKCLTAPVNHALHDNQLLLRLSDVRMLNGEGSEDVELQIHRTLKLKDSSRHAADPGPSSDATPNGHRFSESRAPSGSAPAGTLERMQLDLDTAREEIERLDTAAWTVVSSFESSVARLDKEMQKLNNTMRDLRRDIESSHDEVPRLKSGLAEVRAMVEDKSALRGLEEQLETTNAAVAIVRRLASDAKTGHDELQSELQSTKRDLRKVQSEASDLRKDMGVAKKAAKDAVAATEAYAKDFAALRAEVLSMGDAMVQDRARRSEMKPANAIYPTRELEIITTNIATISGQAGQVGSLRMEVDLFKPRMERLEARLDTWEAEPHTC
ncbi:hypothetical protein ACHAQA_004225 [Verticillium albo-atrum]